MSAKHSITDFVPRRGLCLIRVDEGNETYRGSDLIVPDIHRRMPIWGTTQSVGVGSEDCGFAAGDTVIYDRWSAHEVYEGTVCYSFVRIDDVRAVRRNGEWFPLWDSIFASLAASAAEIVAGVEVEPLASGILIAHSGSIKETLRDGSTDSFVVENDRVETQATVQSVGPDVAAISVGDSITISPDRGIEIRLGGEARLLLRGNEREDDVLAVVG